MLNCNAEKSELGKPIEFSTGVTLTRWHWYDEYTGLIDACIAAGVVRPEQIPGSPGHPNKTSATYHDGILSRAGCPKYRDERYVFIRLIGRKVIVTIGISDELHEQRVNAEKLRTDAEQRERVLARAFATRAQCELSLLRKTIPEHRKSLCESMRRTFSLIRDPLEKLDGFRFDPEAISQVNEKLEEILELISEAEIRFDAAQHRQHVQQLNWTIAAGDDSFQRSMSALKQAVKI